MHPGTSPLVGSGWMRLDVSELGVGKMGRIRHHGPKRKPWGPSFRIYQTVSRNGVLGSCAPGLGRWHHARMRGSVCLGGAKDHAADTVRALFALGSHAWG